MKQQLKNFQILFIKYLNHSEFMIRKLAARSLISFTTPQDLISTMLMLIRLRQDNLGASNFSHGILLALFYGTKLLENEYRDSIFMPFKSEVEKILSQNQISIASEPVFTKLLAQNWFSALSVVPTPKLWSDSTLEDYHPGATELGLSSLDECKRFIKELQEYSANHILQFFEQNAILEEVLTGPMVEECAKHLMGQATEILQDSELALELLNASTHTKIIKERRYGKSASSSCVALSALAFSAMLIQDDFGMFFGQDGSTYVSLFCDLAECAHAMAQPECQEIERTYAADFMLHLVPVFRQRIFEKCELSIHMRYGLVQVINTGLSLLNDEDYDVRMKAVEFVCNLTQQKICVTKAMESLSLIGLQFFEDCAEYFQPVLQLSPLHWNFPDEEQNQLFENGDGINVYNEPAFNSSLYARVILEWLVKIQRRPVFRILNCPSNLIDKIDHFKAIISQEHLLVFAPWLRPKGYSYAVQVYNFLNVVSQHPFLLQKELTNEQELVKMKETRDILAEKLLFRS